MVLIMMMVLFMMIKIRTSVMTTIIISVPVVFFSGGCYLSVKIVKEVV